MIKAKDVTEKLGYIEISHVNNLNGQINQFAYNYIKLLPSGSKIPLKRYSLLLSKVRPYRNANALFLDNDNLFTTASKNAFSVYNLDDCEFPFYITAFMRGYYGYNQIIMRQSGTSYPTVSDDDISYVKIPILDRNVMEQIDLKLKDYVLSNINETNNINKIISLMDSMYL